MSLDTYNLLLAVAGGIFFVAALLALGRMLAGPNSMDRLVSMDSVIAMSQGMLAVYIAWSMDTSVVYAMVVIALLGFIASLAVARFRVPDKRPSPPPRVSTRESLAAQREAERDQARAEDLKPIDEKEDHF